MPVSLAQLRAVLAAAKTLLAARASGAIFADAWDELTAAVQACSTPTPPTTSRAEEFWAERGGAIVRRMTPPRGDPYVQRCPKRVFDAVAKAVADATGSFIHADLRAAVHAPWSQVGVALAFLKSRDLVVRVGARHHAENSATALADAMTAYRALCDQPR